MKIWNIGLYEISQKNEAIIIFTKDRPKVLVHTLSLIRQFPNTIIILDDSNKKVNQEENKRIVSGYANIHYHGINEQEKLISRIQVHHLNLKAFINQLGVKEWNLGYARNYAIILSRVYKFKKVLLMDDDIKVQNIQLINEIFDKLNSYNFVGSKVTVMEDDSVIGHIVRKLGLKPEEYFSGGFIAFRSKDICECFINQYNEDWIWMYLHNVRLKFMLYGEVIQQTFDPYKNWKKKVNSQEIGELLVDGVKEAFQAKDIGLLSNLNFWKRILQEKQEYYEILSDLSKKKGLNDLQLIIKFAARHSSTIKPALLLSTFNDYFKQRKKWQKILSNIDNIE